MSRFLTSFGLLLISIPASAADWAQWRGPFRDGHIKADRDWPSTLEPANLKQSWRVPLGPSYSGPVVVEQHVIVTETVGKKEEIVRSLDRRTGEEIWRAKWPGSITVPFFASENGSWIRSTPVSDGQRVFVAGMRDVLVCLDVKTGKELWRVDLVKEFSASLPGFGTVCSPLLDGDAVYIQAAASVVKLRQSDGEILWRSEPESGGLFGAGMGASAFSSPVIAELAGTRQLVVQSRERLLGIDLQTGQELWTVDIPAFRGMNILTPLVMDDTIFTSSYGGGSFLYRISKAAERFTVEPVWQNNKQGYMSSPVLVDQHIYLHLRNQRVVCLDPSDGSTTWTSKPMGKYWSMVVNGDRILALDQRGELRLIAANHQQYSPISTMPISESPTWAHLAISEDQIFIRELDGISAWQWQ